MLLCSLCSVWMEVLGLMLMLVFPTLSSQPPVQLAVNVIVFPVFCVDGSVGEEVSVGTPNA